MFVFLKKKKARRRPRRRAPRSPAYGRSDQEILMKLDAIATPLRKHDLDIETKLEQVAVAKRVLKQTKLRGLIEDRISRKMGPGDIARELMRHGACSRATAYRYLERIPLKVAISKKETEPRSHSFH